MQRFYYTWSDKNIILLKIVLLTRKKSKTKLMRKEILDKQAF